MIPALLTLWICVLLLRPPKPWGADEARWYFYYREKGRHTWALTIASALTILMLSFWLVGHSHPAMPNRDMSRLRNEYTRYGDCLWVLDAKNNWKIQCT